MAVHTIGEAARAAGVTTRAVRLYESRGLLAPAVRTDAGYRLFSDADVEVLAFIRRGRSLGLSLDAIAEIIAASDDGSPCCDRTQALLAQRLDEIDQAIADLQRLRAAVANAQQVKAEQRDGSRCVVIENADRSPAISG